MTTTAPARPDRSTRLAFARFAAAALAATLAACGAGGGGEAAAPAPSPPSPPPAPFSTLQPVGGGTSIEARTSQAPTNGSAPSEVLDEFSLASAASITTLRWQGIYCTAVDNAPAPAATASAFVVSIYADAAGSPNLATPLLRQTYPIANTGQTLTRNWSGLTCTGGNNTTWAVYDYSITLPSAFAAAAGTRYWLSVQAVTPSYDVYWGWRDGRLDNNYSLQCFQGTCTSYTVDRAFALGV